MKHKKYLILASLFLLPACPPASNLSGGGGGGGPTAANDRVDANACGDLSSIDVGRKIQAFLEATVRLDQSVMATEREVRTTCVEMGKILGMSAGLDGDTAIVCNAVAEKIRADLKVGLAAEAQLDIQYQPAVCTVNADVAAQAAAECEARAEADISVTCSGVCEGTCQGGCDGTCQGATGQGGECNGACDGACQGTCQGTCQGSAEVDADASCKANAEVRANVDAQCTEPKLDVKYDAAVVVDASAVERVVRALDAGMPRLIRVHARLNGPVATAAASWSVAARQLGSSAVETAQALGARAICVAGQLEAAARAVGRVQASVSISVEASVSVGGAAGGSIQ